MTTILHIGWAYLLIIYLNWGVSGAALALNITYITNYLVQELYVRVIDWEYFKQFI